MPISIGDRSAQDIRSILNMIESGKKASEHLPTYLEALASALDVPRGWMLDPETMTFRPPPQDETIAAPEE